MPNQHHTTTENGPLTQTPALEKLLQGLRGQLRLLILAEGFGSALIAVGLWCAFAFLADFVLGVPRGIRIAHGILLALLPLAALVRFGLRHLGQMPGRRGMAVLLERANPGHDELFVSAADFQLVAGERSPDAKHLVQTVLKRADQAALAIDIKTKPVFTSKGPFKRFGLGLLATALIAGAGFTWPTHAGIFAGRLVGGENIWPQLTFLSVELGVEPVPDVRGDELHVRIARGEDLPISVRATGRIPDNVELSFSDGATLVLRPVGRGVSEALFTTTLRGLQKDIEFVARGGDDRREIPRVVIEVLEPPDLINLAIAVTPPPYTGSIPFTIQNADATVLAGSTIQVFAQVDAGTAGKSSEKAASGKNTSRGITGQVRLLPEDRLLPLVATTVPGTGVPALMFKLHAKSSLRFRYELVDPNGLTNPDPGLWAIDVTEDRAPRVEALHPRGLTLETVSGGVLSLAVLAEDDFGIDHVQLTVEDERSEDSIGSFPIETSPLAGESSTLNAIPTVFGFTSIDLSQLLERDLIAGDTLRVEISADDKRQPEPGTGRAPAILIRVLTTDEYMRKVQDRLSVARRRTSELFELQREKLRRTEELLDAAFGEAIGDGSTAGDEQMDPGFSARDRMDLAAAASGQRRVSGDAASLLRELSGLTSDVLHARVDSEAQRQLDQLDSLLAKESGRNFDPDIWSSLVEQHQKGRLGSAGFAGHLLDLTGLAVEIDQVHARAASEALALAEESDDEVDLQDALVSAVQLQAQNLSAIEDLLGRLAEWDNFQSVLSLTRDVLERQKGVMEQTRDLAIQ